MILGSGSSAQSVCVLGPPRSDGRVAMTTVCLPSVVSGLQLVAKQLPRQQWSRGLDTPHVEPRSWLCPSWELG